MTSAGSTIPLASSSTTIYFRGDVHFRSMSPYCLLAIAPPAPRPRLPLVDLNVKISKNLDTYYVGQVMAGYPQILAVCDRLLPEDVKPESSGVGGAAAGPIGAKGAAADAKRREDSKRRAREDNAHLKANKKVS
ncbi:unnamed protein product [Ectocarpus sp. CCAP 1310/34]|nr:unnamed protein product [Ectocarpus sp. CCAP 1310/34]